MTPSERYAVSVIETAIRDLPEQMVFDTLERVLTEQQKQRLAESWFDIDAEVQ